MAQSFLRINRKIYQALPSIWKKVTNQRTKKRTSQLKIKALSDFASALLHKTKTVSFWIMKNLASASNRIMIELFVCTALHNKKILLLCAVLEVYIIYFQ